MIVTVHTNDGEQRLDATGYNTDEHNNLEVMTGSKQEKALALFNRDYWTAVLVGDDGDE